MLNFYIFNNCKVTKVFKYDFLLFIGVGLTSTKISS